MVLHGKTNEEGNMSFRALEVTILANKVRDRATGWQEALKKLEELAMQYVQLDK